MFPLILIVLVIAFAALLCYAAGAAARMAEGYRVHKVVKQRTIKRGQFGGWYYD